MSSPLAIQGAHRTLFSLAAAALSFRAILVAPPAPGRPEREPRRDRIAENGMQTRHGLSAEFAQHGNGILLCAHRIQKRLSSKLPRPPCSAPRYYFCSPPRHSPNNNFRCQMGRGEPTLSLRRANETFQTEFAAFPRSMRSERIHLQTEHSEH